MEIIGEEGTQSPVYEPGHQNLGIRGTALPLEESSGIAACGGIFLLVLHRQRHEVHILLGVLCTCDSRQQHGAADLYDYRTGRLLGEFAGLDLNDRSITHCDGFLNYIHIFLLIVSAVMRAFPGQPSKKKGLPSLS